MFHAWQEQAAKLEQGEITKEEYDQWRYKYPELDTSQHWAKVPSQAVSNMLMEELAKIEKEEKKFHSRLLISLNLSRNLEMLVIRE